MVTHLPKVALIGLTAFQRLQDGTGRKVAGFEKHTERSSARPRSGLKNTLCWTRGDRKDDGALLGAIGPSRLQPPRRWGAGDHGAVIPVAKPGTEGAQPAAGHLTLKGKQQPSACGSLGIRPSPIFLDTEPGFITRRVTAARASRSSSTFACRLPRPLQTGAMRSLCLARAKLLLSVTEDRCLPQLELVKSILSSELRESQLPSVSIAWGEF